MKIRSDEEIEAYNEDLYRLEKAELKEASGYTLVEMIKDCVEQLMNINDKSNGYSQGYDIQESFHRSHHMQQSDPLRRVVLAPQSDRKPKLKADKDPIGQTEPDETSIA